MFSRDILKVMCYTQLECAFSCSLQKERPFEIKFYDTYVLVFHVITYTAMLIVFIKSSRLQVYIVELLYEHLRRL